MACGKKKSNTSKQKSLRRTNKKTTPLQKSSKFDRLLRVGVKPKKERIRSQVNYDKVVMEDLPNTTSYSMSSNRAARIRSGKKELLIPVNRSGNVEKETLMARLVTYKNDDRKRNPHSDIRQTNKVVLDPNKMKPSDVAQWWADPGCCDIKGIDTPDAISKMYRSEGVRYSSKAMEKAQCKIAIIGGDKEDRRKIRKTLNEDFSAAELNRMTKSRDVVVIVNNPGSGKGGYHRGRTSDVYTEDICFRPGSDEDTIAHEFVHALRQRDGTRTGIAKTQYPVDDQGFLKTIERNDRQTAKEESCTVAEANVRSKEPCEPSGYYSYIPNGYGNEYDNYRKDRVSLLGTKKEDRYDTVKAQKGTKAVRTVNERYDRTEISKLTSFPKR